MSHVQPEMAISRRVHGQIRSAKGWVVCLVLFRSVISLLYNSFNHVLPGSQIPNQSVSVTGFGLSHSTFFCLSRSLSLISVPHIYWLVPSGSACLCVLLSSLLFVPAMKCEIVNQQTRWRARQSDRWWLWPVLARQTPPKSIYGSITVTPVFILPTSLDRPPSLPSSVSILSSLLPNLQHFPESQKKNFAPFFWRRSAEYKLDFWRSLKPFLCSALAVFIFSVNSQWLLVFFLSPPVTNLYS